jgi:hypothetical protein
MSTSSNTGALGHSRGVGFGILMYIVTFGVYSFYRGNDFRLKSVGSHKPRRADNQLQIATREPVVRL